MSTTLRKADGDLFIDTATGRSEEVSGPTKVSQELFSLFASTYDNERGWGTDLDLTSIKFSSSQHLRSLLYVKVNQAIDRMYQKQAEDQYLDEETEQIRSFSKVEIIVDAETSSAAFIVVAEVGDPATEVGKTLSLSFKPVSTQHVVPPPFPDGLKLF